MKVHLCLVSAQAAANLLPALDRDQKPEKVVLVVSKKMQSQADNLSQVLIANGVKVATCELEDEHNYDRTFEQLFELASQHEGDDIALNITGGTKLMALAAQSVASVACWRIFYVDVDTDQLIWLQKNNTSPACALNQQLRLRHYLQGYGYSIDKQPVRPQISEIQKKLLETLICQIGSLEKSLPTLNWLAQQAEDQRKLRVDMDDEQCDSRGLEALLRHFENAGALTVQGCTINFTSECQRDFVKGGWLEAHVYQTLCHIKEKIGFRDSAVNLEVSDHAKNKSELDIAFLARNRLFIIECKTARMDKPEAPKANDVLFKLSENSKRIGGSGTHGMLVSYRGLRDSEKQLAKALNIELVCGADLIRLEEKLKHWVK